MPPKKIIKKIIGRLMAAYHECFSFDPATSALTTVMFYSGRGNQFGLEGSWRAAFKGLGTECNPWLDRYPFQEFEKFLQETVADAKEAGASDADTSAVFQQKLAGFFISIDDSQEWIVASAVFGFATGQPPFKIGPCRFFIMDERELRLWAQRRRCARYDPPADTLPRHFAFAQSAQTGLDSQLLGNWIAEVSIRAIDANHATAKAKYRLEEVLNVLRHGAFLFALPEQCVRAGVGRPSYWNSQSMCVRVHPPGGFQDSAGNGADGLVIQTSCLGSSAWLLIGVLIAKEPTSRTSLEATVITALEWVGQAAAAPLGPVRLVSLMTALEVLLLPNDKTRVKCRKVSKRVAGIISDVQADLNGLTPSILLEVQSGGDGLEQTADRLYHVRNECLHAGATQAEDEDVKIAYAFVDAIITAFLAKVPYCKCSSLREALDNVCEPEGGFVYMI